MAVFSTQLSAAMEPTLTLANTPLDLQITICIFLHPFDILALRKTCKALELATRQRIVWVAVLHRVCIDNTLFLPSFPIPDMSDLELERAAMAPRRWIKLCGEFQKQNSDNFCETIHPRTTRIIKDAANLHFFIVPGGRYLVAAGNGLFVWDLGYASTVDCKLVASVGLGDGYNVYGVQATSDGKGLVILSSYRFNRLSIYEIYPQSEIPQLTQIAHLDWFSAQLLPDTLICRVIHQDRIVFRVVDYRTNYSACVSTDINVKNMDFFETFATKTAIIVLCREGLLIWAMPFLSPNPSDLRHFLDNNSTHIPPLFKIPYPEGIVRDTPILTWLTLSSWYFGSLESVYFDILYADSILQRFKIIVEPDLSDVSLHFINISEITGISNELVRSPDGYKICDGYMICDDALVYFWNNRKTWRAYTGLTSAPFTNIVTRYNGHIESLCPTFGRFVYRTDDRDHDEWRKIGVVDLF